MSLMSDRTLSTVYGGPTKRFFVSMLTRDIELNDAILDLLDNCVDGAMRQKRGHLNETAPFSGFHADLILANERFEISDNCGGIPKDFVADAFSLGRPNIQKDGDLPTIGMYGIGMKRAIFKIGTSAVVNSNSSDGFFSVAYTSEWLDPENDQWELPIANESPRDQRKGVSIVVDEVKPDIGRLLADPDFQNTLKKQISEHFGYLMQRGFEVRVNGVALTPATLQLFDAEASDDADIRAFDFEVDSDEVHVRVTIGLFRKLSRESEIDEETESPKSQDVAGISVVCNDRVILLNDRSMKTGWGDGTVPRYHPQFRAIAGLIVFSSNNASKLPISTTKRDLDASSDIYLLARKEAMEGLKTFTDFTNKWKGIEDSADRYFDAARRSDVKREIASAAVFGKSVRGLPGARKFVPSLPLPEKQTERRRISFLRDVDDIRSVSKFLFSDSTQHPSLVGGECFDRVLSEIKK